VQSTILEAARAAPKNLPVALVAKLVAPVSNTRLERSIRSKHDAGDPASKTRRGGNPMLQRVLPVQHPNVALDEKPRAYQPPKARTLVRVFIGQVLRFCRWLAAAGGPLS
jgi:hypothetical protein